MGLRVLRPYQKFDIALRPGNRAGGEAEHRPIFASEPCLHFVTDACVHLCVPDNAAFADFFAARLKLRLNQRDQLRLAFDEG
jgi:hypothetical protein